MILGSCEQCPASATKHLCLSGRQRTRSEEEFVTDERKFTLDGHLVGSIGEVVAACAFGLTLYPSGTDTHDGESEDGRRVQIKLTGGIRGVHQGL
jgi:hypothetical protein